MLKRPPFNNQIRAKEVRLIDEEGKQIGIFSLEKAFLLAKEKNLDLIQVTDKTTPPVCKLAEYGKYLYWLKKKERPQKNRGDIKGIRLSFNISPHDLETRANQAEKFLRKGNKVKIEMILRGREKSMESFAKEKFSKFLEILGSKIQIKIERELKKEPKGFTIIIAKT